MPTPDDIERAARAIGDLLRGAKAKTLKPKDFDFLEPRVLAGMNMLFNGAKKMRELK